MFCDAITGLLLLTTNESNSPEQSKTKEKGHYEHSYKAVSQPTIKTFIRRIMHSNKEVKSQSIRERMNGMGRQVKT